MYEVWQLGGHGVWLKDNEFGTMAEAQAYLKALNTFSKSDSELRYN